MKIVIAPDSFKESLSAWEACQAIGRGLERVFPEAELVHVPMADGGEGTVQSLVDATGGRIVRTAVTGPLGTPVEGFYGVLGDGKSAVIEMAAASGLALVPPEQRNPLVTTTRGMGELILSALSEGVETIILGLGGSATNDGGAGMAQALGIRLMTEDGTEIGYGGGELGRIAHIDMSGVDPRLARVKFIAACDVDNPLIGERGASAVFGPQKGATADMVKQLDANLAHYASQVLADVGCDVAHMPGAGAAGGLGAGVVAFLQAELKRGVDIVVDATGLAEHAADADMVITGEGKIDGQTIYGKTPIGVAKAAKLHGIPVIGIAGTLAAGYESVHEHGIDMVFTIVPGVTTLEDALQHASANMERTAYNIGMALKFGKLLKS